MKTNMWLGRAFGAVLLAGSLGACDYINVSDRDPNIVSEARIEQLWVSAQVNTYLFAEGQIGRLSAVFTQQLAGTDRQFALTDQYIFNESELDGEFTSIYTGGGLVDLRRGEAIADSVNCASCKSLFQIHEAYIIGMAASVFGDLPYSEAVNPDIENPVLDPQQNVYAAIQGVLDEAIAGLTAGPGAGASFYTQMASADFNFNGNRDQWKAVAYTLKARFYMHWVEAQLAGGASLAAAQTACGGDCIVNAQAAAMNGIKAPSGNWRGIHSSATTENNLFFQFFRDRAGYTAGGAYLVNLLQTRNDPRLGVYFDMTGDDEFVGSAPGEGNSAASQVSITGVGAPDYNQPIVLCSENQFILAETYFYQNNTAQAQANLQAGVDCQETLFAAYPAFEPDEIPVPGASLTGNALLSEIITQKYIALFLNPEALNDYKRTCLPALTTFNNQVIPRRIFYGRTERQTNSTNILPPDQQPAFNTNDPTLIGTSGVRCGGAP